MDKHKDTLGSIDLLYDIEQIINPSRLTKALDQFG